MPANDPAPWSHIAALAPGGVYLSNDEHVRLVAYSSAAGVRLALEGRLVAPDGSVNAIRNELAPTSDRLASTVIANAREGWLLHGQVRVLSGTPKLGQLFARVEVVRGRTGDVIPLATLAQGYLAELSNLPWPHRFNAALGETRGYMRSVTGSDPAAGAEVSETVPTGAVWRLVAFRATLVTDATVANRRVNLTIDDGTNTLLLKPPGADQAASLTYIYQADANGAAAALLSTTQALPLPPDLFLRAGFRIRTATNSIQAGDNWAAPQLLVEEWIEG